MSARYPSFTFTLQNKRGKKEKEKGGRKKKRKGTDVK